MLAYCLSIQRGIAVRLHKTVFFKTLPRDRFPAGMIRNRIPYR